MVILFGSEDGAGLVVSNEGIRPLPPFDPRTRTRLKAIGVLVKANALVSPNPAGDDMRGLAHRVARSIVPMVMEKAGDAATGENSIIYLDPDGSFMCGTNGQPPVLVPWPAPALG